MFDNLLQHNVRRMLAYSSIAQMGYVIVAIISGSYQAAAYYAIAYGVISLAAFGSIAVLERTGCGSTLDDYRGRGSSSPLASGVLTLALLALAGIPPTAGFTGKFLIFGSAVRSGEMPLAIFGILTVAVSIYYYLRVVSVLYFTEPKRIDQEQITTIEALVLLIASLVIVLLGLFPSSLLELFTRLSS